MKKDSCLDHESNTASAKTWEVVEEWINHCLETYSRCNEYRNSTWWPTRVLDVESNENCVRLVETANESLIGRYMTLSHRWGSSKPLSLRQATLKDMLKGVLLQTLPQTFQDAIIICQRLKIRYIWIDSLCIMQDKDDLSDWIREAALMHKVYSHSFLNISSLAAHDSSYSLFADRDRSLLDDIVLKTTLDGIRLGETEKSYRVIDILSWEQEMNLSPLNLRAWVLQERLLSPRAVHFGPRQVLWECHEFDPSESNRHGLPAVTKVLRNIVRFKDIDSGTATRHPLQSESLGTAPYGAWNRIVQAYTRCGLTKKQDKLVALAGIAKHMASKLDDQYVAGMWRRTLPWEIT